MKGRRMSQDYRTKRSPDSHQPERNGRRRKTDEQALNWRGPKISSLVKKKKFPPIKKKLTMNRGKRRTQGQTYRDSDRENGFKF